MHFMAADLHPSPDAQDVVSFGTTEDVEEDDDFISVAASEKMNGPTARWNIPCPVAVGL